MTKQEMIKTIKTREADYGMNYLNQKKKWKRFYQINFTAGSMECDFPIN